MRFTLARSAAGFAVLAAVAAGCATTGSTHPAAPNPPASAHHNHASAQHASNAIPQGNAGDQDPDNNGGPSDGDGNI